jgi:hypothetical protein
VAVIAIGIGLAVQAFPMAQRVAPYDRSAPEADRLLYLSPPRAKGNPASLESRGETGEEVQPRYVNRREIRSGDFRGRG